MEERNLESNSLNHMLKNKKKHQQSTENIEKEDNVVNRIFNEIIEYPPESSAYIKNQCEIFVLYEYDSDNYIPESEIIKNAFKYLLYQELKVIKLPHNSFFKKNLPVLRVNDEFIEKENLMDFLLKITYDNKKENSYSDLFLINSIKNILHPCSQYFIWINPTSSLFYYRDPYWLFWNPLKKMQHFMFLKGLRNSLSSKGINDPISAVSKATQIFQIIARYKNEKEVAFLREEKEIKTTLVDFVIFFYLKEILSNPQTCMKLNEELQENYHIIIDFMEIFEEKIEKEQIIIPTGFSTKITLLEKKPATKDVCRLETPEAQKKKIKKKLLITSSIISILGLIYWKYE